jgi:hypothetical protein
MHMNIIVVNYERKFLICVAIVAGFFQAKCVSSFECVRKFVFLVFIELIPVAVKVRHPRMQTLLRQV